MSPDVRREYAVWLNVRFCLGFLLAARKVAGGDLVSALLLGCVVGANLGHLDHRPEDTRRFGALGSPSDADRHPVNSKSLSDSLGIPRETARAKISALVDAGILRRLDQGVILPSATIRSPEVGVFSHACLDALADLVAGLRIIEACGIERKHHLAQPVWPMAGAVIRLGAGQVVRAITYARPLTGDLGLTDTFILLAVADLTGGHLRGSQEAPGELHSLPTPMERVRGSTVASFLGMPDATVRRHLDALVEHDQLARSVLGYGLVASGTPRRLWDEFQHRTEAVTAQFMWRLRQSGVVASAHPQLATR